MNYNLCDDFIKYKRYLGYKYNTEVIVMNEIKSFLKNNNIKEITKDVIENYVRLNPNRCSNSIARNINVFKEFCMYLRMQGIKCYQIPRNLYPQKIRKYVPYIFSNKEIKFILENIKIVAKQLPYSYIKEQTIPLIIRVLYQTGMRAGEVLNLKINDYDIDNSCFIIHESKNSEERLIYLPDDLNLRILDYHSKFHSKTNNVYFFQLGKTKIDIGTVENNFYKALILSNIKRKEHSPRVT